MNRRTMLALVAFVALGGTALLVTLMPEKGEQLGPAPRPLAPVTAATVDHLEVTNGGKTVVLKKIGDKWTLEKPLAAPADGSIVGDALTAIATLEWGDVVSTQKAKWGSFELTDDKACHVVAKQAGKTVADLYFGQVLSGATMTRLAGKDEVWQTIGSFRSQLVHEVREWRDRQLLQVNATDVTGLTFERVAVSGSTLAGKVELQRSESSAAKSAADAVKEAVGQPAPTSVEWKVASSTVPLAKLDGSIADAMVSTLTSLQAYDVADGKQPAETGLGAGGEGAQLRVTLTHKSGSATVLEVGKARGDKKEEYYASSSQHPSAVYIVKTYALERVLKSPYDFRDKAIVTVNQADITGLDIRITPAAPKPADQGATKPADAGASSSSDKASTLVIQRDGTAWKAKVPAGLALEEPKVTPLLAAAADLRASSFAADFAAPPNGLDHPSATITLQLKGGASKVLKVGKLVNEVDYPVQLVGGPEVYLIKKYVLERLLKRPQEVGTLARSEAATAKK